VKREDGGTALGFSLCHDHQRRVMLRALQSGSPTTLVCVAAASQRTSRVRCRKRALVLSVVATCIIIGCAQTPIEHTEALAREAGASIGVVAGAEFDHVVFSHNLNGQAQTLHIYFSGDGTPWIHRTEIARDPTPRNPMYLQLMLSDPSPSIYLGRPCYLGLATASGCTPALWTVARYSSAIVDSMVAAVQRVIDESQATEIVLFGYSGGGVLALLVANRVPRINTVVTVGANLDVDAWTTLHGYSPLSQSLSPIDVTSWRDSLRQIHLVGADDRNVTPMIVWRFARSRPEVEVRVIPGFDHRCCWVDAWPTILRSF